MATWQHLRSSTAHKRPTTSLADGRIAINTNTASPGLFFKDSAGTGIVKIGPVHVGTTAPNSTPAVGGSSGNYLGEQWLDTSLTPAQLKVWNGSAWVGVVADELPVSKLQDGAARQLLQTDAAGTGVEWTSNVDVPGTLDVTSTATFDSIARHPLGSAAAPTITFTGDTNTGIYSPGADQVAISTNGAGRLFVDASGNINIDSGGVYYDAVNNRLAVGTTSPIALTHISNGASISVLDADADDLFVSNSGNAGITIATGANNKCTIAFGEAGVGNSRGRIVYDTNDESAQIYTANSERARIDSSGRLLVGTSTSVSQNIGGGTVTPQIQLAGLNQNGSSLSLVNYFSSGSPANLALGSSTGGSVGVQGIVANNNDLGRISFTGSDGSTLLSAASILAEVDGTPGANDMPGRLVFSTTADGASSPTERLRITSDGKLGLGTTSPLGNLHILSSTTGLAAVNNAGDELVIEGGGNSGMTILAGNTSQSSIYFADSDNAQSGAINYSHNDNSLAFRVNGSERARIDSSGRLLVGTSSVAAVNTPKLCTATNAIESSLSLGQYRNSAAISADLDFVKSRSGIIGTAAAVSTSDTISQMRFYGAGDASTYVEAAQITASVDGGTVSATSLAGRLVFSTTADGASSPTERMRIKSSGIINFSNTPVYADNAAATTGGLAIGDVYRTSTGQLMIRY